MAKASFRHVFECSVETFWDKVFFDEEYNRRLYEDALGFPGYEILSLEDRPDGSKVRRVRQTPKQEFPSFLRKLAGDGFSYVEDGRFDPETKHFRFQVKTSSLSDKVQIHGDFWCEPRGEGRCERICEMDFKVSIFGVGGKIEDIIRQQSERSYELAAEFTNRWLREKQLAGI
jgi:hypothetical protein